MEPPASVPPARLPLRPAATAPEDRVPLAQKLGYGLGTFHDVWGHWLYPILGFQVFNIFLGVAPWLVSTAMMLNRLFDAVSDPFFGWLSDNTRSRFGRRRPYLLIGGVLAGLMLPLLVAVGPGWGESTLTLPLAGPVTVSHYFWFMLGSSALFIPVMSCFNMPYQSLGAELTPDYHERTSVMSVKNAVQKIPELAIYLAVQFTTLSIFNGIDGRPNILRGAQVMCAILGGVMILAAITQFLLVKERYYRHVATRRQARVSLKDTFGQTLRSRPFRIQMGVRMSYAVGTSMIGTLGYYDTVYYVSRGDVADGTKWNSLMGISGMVFGLLGIPCFAAIARRFGKRTALGCALGLAFAVFVATWWTYDPSHPWLQLFASGPIAFTAAGVWMLDGSIGADVIDDDELQTGQRREGAFTSCASWITKLGMAFGAGAAGWILTATGFDAQLGGAQTEHALFNIRFFMAVIPLVGIALALVGLARFPLTPERMAEIRAQLEAQRGKI